MAGTSGMRKAAGNLLTLILLLLTWGKLSFSSRRTMGKKSCLSRKLAPLPNALYCLFSEKGRKRLLLLKKSYVCKSLCVCVCLCGHKEMATGVVTQKVGPHQRLVTHYSVHLDPVAVGAPACHKSVAAAAATLPWDILQQSMSHTRWRYCWNSVQPQLYHNNKSS